MEVYDEVNILGVPYKLKFVDSISKERLQLGEIDYLNQEISILKGMAMETQYITILHEVIHGVLSQLGFEEAQDEHLIDSLATGLYQVLSDNNIFNAV